VRLIDALDLNRGERLACVGAGGKTTLCWRAWSELRAASRLPIFTTTTHILEPILPPGTALYLARAWDRCQLSALAQTVSALVAAAHRLPEPFADFVPNPIAPARPFKLAGPGPEQIDDAFDALAEATWIVEADGARGRGLKWPADHEPSIPSRTTTVAVLACLDVIGQRLSDGFVHRPERLGRRIGLEPGSLLSADHVARVMNDPSGGLKGVPAGARAIGVLNQSDAAGPHPDADAIVERLLMSGSYARVVVASLRADQPVLGVHTA